METQSDPQAASAAPVEREPNPTPAIRLVIRARIIREAPPQPIARQPFNRRALLWALGALAVLTLGWIGISVFSTDPTSTPTVNEGARDVRAAFPAPVPAPSEAAPTVSAAPPPQPATSPAEAGSIATTPVESEMRGDPSLSPINEVIPTVPRSALQTIRGTIKVSIRVIVDKEGRVLAATADDPGPSRYFERLAIEASRKWTFAPTVTPEQRTMLVRFNFTRQGATARAERVQ